jgi:hypothetical protein
VESVLKRIVAISALILRFLAPSLAAEKPFVRVRWKSEQFRITYKTAVMTYDLQAGDEMMTGSVYSKLFMAQINKITTDYLEEKNGVVYMVLNIEGSSRGEEGAMGQCGAGEEKGKGLFVFNETGELKAPVFVVNESCFNTIEPTLSTTNHPRRFLLENS